MEERITLTLKELKRLKVIELTLAKQLRCKEAAEKLGISERQFYRILNRYKAGGEQGLAHASRGRPSPKRLPTELLGQISILLENEYADYNSLHLLEVLEKEHHINLSYSSLQNIRRELGYITPRKKKAAKHRSRRDPSPIIGMMLQADASIHPWLEERGPKLALHAFIDDADNRIWASFCDQEDTFGYILVLRDICLTQGIPMSLYTDRRNVFQGNQKLSLEDQLNGIDHKSHFKTLLSRLGIQLMQATSPQAKGRIERLFGTLQDRLVKALRKAEASTLEQANLVLADFLPEFNRSFMHSPAQPGSAFVPWNQDHSPDDYFCCRFSRIVRNDNTFSFHNVVLQIPPSPFRHNFARAQIVVLQFPSGDLKVLHNGTTIATYQHDPCIPARVERFFPTPQARQSVHFLPDFLPAPEYDLAMST